MFERFTEKARRAVFFARYEASSLGVRHIDTEHLLLGILRDDKALIREIQLNVDYESAHSDAAQRVDNPVHLATTVDLPLAEDAKQALKYAAEEADRLKAKHIGTEHLLLGLIRDAEFPSAKCLTRFVPLESLRKTIEALPERISAAECVNQSRRVPLSTFSVEIHDKKLNAEMVREKVKQLKGHPWLWERKLWKARDVVYERDGKRFSFDLTIAGDTSKYVLVKRGWKRDVCAICGWELLESDEPTHNVGFTNGRDWVCEECNTKFILGGFFESAYSDLT